MVSGIGNNNFYTPVNKSSDVSKVSNVQNVSETQNISNRALEIKEQIHKGEYKLMPPHILAKVFAEVELGLDI